MQKINLDFSPLKLKKQIQDKDLLTFFLFYMDVSFATCLPSIAVFNASKYYKYYF